MIFSLPSYRRLSDADLDRLRRSEGRHFSNRSTRVLFNLLLLAGLWGVPLYARWILLADAVGAESMPKALLGEWSNEEKTFLGERGNEEKICLAFSADQQIRLYREGRLIETAEYWLAGDLLVVSDFTRHRRLSVNPQHYRITIRGDQLTITPSRTGFTPIAERSEENSVLRRYVLPPYSDHSVHFRRQNKR